jgi:periplasmic divalent cation tolerance protein
MVTAPNLDEARSLARTLLEQRLAACVNILPALESHYRWKGDIEKAGEVLLLIKSTAEHFAAVVALVQEKHSYDCPEIVAVKPEAMSESYRAWWEESLK